MLNSKSKKSEDRFLWRSRWAAIGAAVAVSLGTGGLLVANAAPASPESTVVTVTPERILDTRDPVNLGLVGPFTSATAQKLKVTGAIPTATGTKTVVPDGATGVLLNVTPVNAGADGYISIRPGDATGGATTSSLNFTARSVMPNSVQVALPTSGANAGQIDITYNAYGVAGPTTDVLIDVVGYMTDAGLEALSQQVVALEAAQDAADTKIGDLEAAQTATDTQVGNLETAQSDAEDRLDVLEANQSFAVGANLIDEVALDGTEFLTPATVLSLNVIAPADGTFSVIANTTARSGTGSVLARAVCQINTGSIIDVNLPLGIGSTLDNRPTLGTNKVIPVTSGQNVTINFNCAAPEDTDTGTVVEYRSMLAIFTPSP